MCNNVQTGEAKAEMESKEEAVHFTQEKHGEAVTLKVRFAQFKEAVGPTEYRTSSGSCLKLFNIILSVILLVVGIVCVIMGIICHAKYYYHFKYIGEGYVNVVTVFIVSGIVMIVAGSCGIFCIVRRSYGALVLCLIIIAILLIFHFVLGGFAFAYRSRANQLTQKALTEGFHMYFSNDKAKHFMDWSQRKFKCCGLSGPKDYAASKTHSSTKAPHVTTQKPTHHANTTTQMSTSPTTLPSTTTTKPPTTVMNTTTAAVTTVTTTNITTLASTTNSPTTTTKATTTEPPTTTTKPTTTTSTTVPSTTTTKATTTTTKAPTTTTNAPTTATTTNAPTTTTKAPTTTTNAPTTATTTNAPTTTTKAPATTKKAPTTTKVPTTTTKPSTTMPATTTKPATTKPATITTASATTKNIVNAAADALAFKSEDHGLPKTCCKKGGDCSGQSASLYHKGCHGKVDNFLEKIMCAIGSIAFVMIFFDLLHLITGALCSKKIKEESSYDKF